MHNFKIAFISKSLPLLKMELTNILIFIMLQIVKQHIYSINQNIKTYHNKIIIILLILLNIILTFLNMPRILNI